VFLGDGRWYFAEISDVNLADIYGGDSSICIWRMYLTEIVDVYLAEIVDVYSGLAE